MIASIYCLGELHLVERMINVRVSAPVGYQATDALTLTVSLLVSRSATLKGPFTRNVYFCLSLKV